MNFHCPTTKHHHYLPSLYKIKPRLKQVFWLWVRNQSYLFNWHMICQNQLRSLFSVPPLPLLHWLDNFYPTHDRYVPLKLLFSWRLTVQETVLFQPFQMGPENQNLPWGKHNAVSQSPVQHSSPLCVFSPAKLICLKYNCKLIKRFLTGDLILRWTMGRPPRWCHTSAREEAEAKASLLYILQYKAAFHSFPPAPT